ncbi:hypothetical protein PI125_g3239 [Phytophthora idaei]|nr:hypothetical protein PI125_g3239 [Phytophthora idaei]KAG3167639.1 hypothetical protein PI126_g3762 [Phytophthora idaei]
MASLRGDGRPVVADVIIVRLRDMRFTFDIVVMAINEKDNASSFEVSSSEITDVTLNAISLVLSATFFAWMRSWAPWADLTSWNPTQIVLPYVKSAKNRYCALNSTTDSNTDKHQDPSPAEDSELDPTHVTVESLNLKEALNTTLNELFKHGLQPHERDTAINAKAFIDSTTEKYTLFGHDTLYRLTTGFQGDLAFDVNVSDQDPPNVLVIVIESFRYHDSHYLVGDKDPSNLFKGSNITITPNFDKWAKRGITLRNYWSSWRTSRSVESLMFGQLPYDSVTKSGMTGGQRDTKLSGLPQLFQAKGYETFFTTGCLTDYDNWDAFLPAHGFDTVWSRNEMKKLAESDLGIKHSDWDGPEHRALNWGVHGDLSFQLLGDLMVNKTKAQKSRMATGEAKKPLFLNHYTISSHVDYKQRPKWYANADKPDFSALYDGQKYAHNIKNYLEMRYFTDMDWANSWTEWLRPAFSTIPLWLSREITVRVQNLATTHLKIETCPLLVWEALLSPRDV